MEFNIHYIAIIVAIAIIISMQIKFFAQNRDKLRLLKSIFDIKKGSSLETSEIGNATIIIEKPQGISPVFSEIIDTINDYLYENKGAASDFHLIKDVVDRNCDSVEEEVATLTPIPLYFGLIGTMIGILVGVAFLVFSGGIDSLLTAGDVNAGAGIVELLGGVALAMVSSIVGIGLTTYGSYLTKGAKNQLNGDKNKFLSWIQVKLLPSLSGNATSAIYTLQSNLTTFNKTFSDNIEGMNDAFSVVGQSYKDQLELMTILRDLDISKMATANVQVLKELKKSTVEFERFNQYLHNVSNYIDNVQKLNSGINEHLNRTQLIEQMGEFFKEEIQQIESRKGLINSVAGEIDNTLRNTLNQLEESADKQIQFFIENSVALQEKFNKVIEEQAKEANRIANEQRDKFNSAIEEQASTMQMRLKETATILEEIKHLKDVKSSMDGIESATREQNKKLDSLISVLSEGNYNNIIPQSSNGTKTTSKLSTIAIVVTCAVVSIAALLYIGKEAYEMFTDETTTQSISIKNDEQSIIDNKTNS